VVGLDYYGCRGSYVAAQIVGFNKLKKELGSTNQVDEFFQKKDIRELFRDIQNGYVRRDHFTDMQGQECIE